MSVDPAASRRGEASSEAGPAPALGVPQPWNPEPVVPFAGAEGDGTGVVEPEDTLTESKGVDEPETADFAEPVGEREDANPEERHDSGQPIPDDGPASGADPGAVSIGPPSASVDLAARLDLISTRLVAMERLFEARILTSEAEAQANAKLHAELQVHKNDLYQKLVKPILSDVITARQHLLKLVAVHREKPEGGQVVGLDSVASFADDLAQLLEDNEVEIFRSAPGDPFDSRLHQAVAKVDTGDPSAHKTIATTVGDAYIFQGRSLARQLVTVFTYDAREAGES